MDKMELDQLRPEFFDQVMTLRKKILTRCKPKTLNGKELSGEMFLGLSRSYLAAINQGAVPNIENAWHYLCRQECQKAVDKGFETYDKILRETLYPRLPTVLEEIKIMHRQAKEAAIEVFMKR